MLEKFSTQFYEAIGVPVCPNGDQVRSDDEGLFCWIDGDRVAAVVVNGVVVLDEIKLEPPKTKKPAGEKADANG